jgi:hypothetical protein
MYFNNYPLNILAIPNFNSGKVIGCQAGFFRVQSLVR